MVNSEEVQATVLIGFGAFFVGIGAFMGLDAFTTMEHLEAQRLIGQSGGQQQYQDAMWNLKLFGSVAAVGLVFVFIGTADYLKATLEDLAGV